MKKLLKYLVAICLLLVIWIVADWYWPVKSSIRRFDADMVAAVDAKMWQSYYAKEPVKMFFQLAQLLRKEFHAPFFRSHVMAYYAAKAAFVFKKGKDHGDYEKALPYLEKYYMQLHRISKEDFDLKRASKTELEWWIVHRDKRQYNANDLQHALQNNAAAVYGLPDSAFKAYALYRTKAMQLCDEKQKREITESDWKTIENYLQLSWSALSRTVSF